MHLSKCSSGPGPGGRAQAFACSELLQQWAVEISQGGSPNTECLAHSPPPPTRPRPRPAAGCDCAAIRLLPTDTPVCDAQGMSYANACLAECQGISAGPCMALRNSGAAPPLVHADMLDSEAPITLGDIDAFKAEGFRLAARVKMTTGTPYIPGLAPT